MNRARFKIGQQNLHHSVAATADCLMSALESGIDVLLIQDPYVLLNKRDGIYQLSGGLNNRIRLIADQSVPFTACIVVINEKVHAFKHAEFCGNRLAAATLSLGNFKIDVVSAYWPPARDFQIEDQLDILRRISLAIETALTPLVLAVDTNAKHTVWYADDINERGENIINVFNELNWVTLNRPHALKTFKGTRGESNIDVMAANNKAISILDFWDIADVGLSDHRLIIAEFTCFNIRQDDKWTFCKSKINSEKAIDLALNGRIELEMDVWEPTTEFIDRRVDKLTNLLKSIMTETVPRKRIFVNKPIWWNERVEKARKKCLSLRRKYQSEVNVAAKEGRRITYLESATKFREILTQERNKSWSNFAETELRRDPWGIPYRVAAAKLKKSNRAISSVEKEHGQGHTRNFEETIQEVFSNFFQDDVPDADTVNQALIRDQAGIYLAPQHNFEHLQPSEVEEYLCNINIKKAPGVDGILGIVIRTTGIVFADYLCRIFNDCLLLGYFPKQWKRGKLITIPKPGKSQDRIKNLRPITLLPILAKTFEHFIRKRMLQPPERIQQERDAEEPEPVSFHHERQFGFVAGKSTEDAIEELLTRIHTGIAYKYTSAIFLDIKGAFNNVWWPAIFTALKNKECKKYIYNILCSYLQNREVVHTVGETVGLKVLSKGCPQGSKLGPDLWNLAVDLLLESFDQEENIHIVAYADDLVVVTYGNSRPELEVKMTRALALLDDWANCYKMEFALDKCKYIVFGDKLSRNPMAHLGGGRISRTRCIKYLGITLDEKLLFTDHINEVCRKAKTLFQWLKRSLSKVYTMPMAALRQIFFVAVLPVLTYAARFFIHRIGLVKNRTKLDSIRAIVSRTITGAYCTAATDAVAVLALIPPIDELIRESVDLKGYKSGAVIRDAENHLLLPGLGRNSVKAILRNRTLNIWQADWDASTKGRLTYSFMNSIEVRAEIGNTLKLDRNITQMLTGHGQFRAYFKKINKIDNDFCTECNLADDPVHRLEVCNKFVDQREALLDVVGRNRPLDLGTMVAELSRQERLEILGQFIGGRLDI